MTIFITAKGNYSSKKEDPIGRTREQKVGKK